VEPHDGDQGEYEAQEWGAPWNRCAAASNSNGGACWDAASDERMAWDFWEGRSTGLGRSHATNAVYTWDPPKCKERRLRKTRTSRHDRRKPHSFTGQAHRHGPHAPPTRHATRPTARTTPDTVAGPPHPIHRKRLSITAKATPQHHNQRPATLRLRPPPKTPTRHNHQTTSNQRPSRHGTTRAKDTPQTQGGGGTSPPPPQRPRGG